MKGAQDMRRGAGGMPAAEATAQSNGASARSSRTAVPTACLVSSVGRNGHGCRLALGPEDSLGVLGRLFNGSRGSGAAAAVRHVSLDGELLPELRNHRPAEVYFVLGGPVTEALLADVGPRLLMDGVAVSVVLSTPGCPPVRAVPIRVGGLTGVSLLAIGEPPHWGALRRAIDVLGALTLVMLLAPLFAAVALLVRLGMGSPIIFAQQRVGRFGRPFRVFKFRSMVPDAERILRAAQSLPARTPYELTDRRHARQLLASSREAACSYSRDTWEADRLVAGVAP